MPVYSVPIFQGEVPAAQQLFTADPSATWVVRDLEAWNVSASSSAYTLSVNSSPGAYLGAIDSGTVVEPNFTRQWVGRVVLGPEDFLLFNATSFPWRLLISGYRLALE